MTKRGRNVRSQGRRAVGFTLIELLIVVAIIAILALIAVPNFLEAQVRAKAARSRNDLRSLAVAEEAYMVDWNSYTNHAGGANSGNLQGWRQLTSPVAYTTSIPADPFGLARHPGGKRNRLEPVYELGSGSAGIGSAGTPGDPGPGFPANTWQMSGHGPDNLDDTVTKANSPPPGRNWSWNEARYPWADIPPNDPAAVREALSLLYDPTNGTVSAGNILRFGGMKPSGQIFDLLYSLASK